MSTYDLEVFFVKDRDHSPVAVYWTDRPALQAAARKFFHFFRTTCANIQRITLSVPGELTPKEILADLRDRGVISSREANHSSILVHVDVDEPLSGKILKNGRKIMVVLRSFAVNPA